MNFKKEFNALVILGNWNNAIFNPDWITKNIIPDTKWNVEIPLNANASMRMSTDEYRIFIIDGKLNFAVLKHEDNIFAKIGDIAVKISDKLIHTPVSAFGINFVFETEPNETIDELFALNDNENILGRGFSIQDISVKRRLKSGEKLVNLNIVKAENKIIFDFNYHTAINSLIDFKDKFETDYMVSYKNEALDLLSELYALDFE